MKDAHALPKSIKLVEVGPRDGLQNEAGQVPTAVKVELVERLAEAGLRTVEVTSFVSARWVPQMADHAEVLRAIRRKDGVAYPVLTPNLQGLEAAVAAGAKEVAIFGAASETFSRRNINCSIEESLARFVPVLRAAEALGIPVRGYASCVVDCPFEGHIQPEAAADLARRLFDLGCCEISLGDTTGRGHPASIARMVEACARVVPMDRLAGHYHDTYGMAVANIHASLRLGMRVFDSSVAGLGGCPYAPGATGNVATEDVVWLMRGLGVETGVDLEALVSVSAWISACLGRPPASRVARALLAKGGGGEACAGPA
ncbi:hydroxymethylglutaryl-CoA lyase [Geothrix limicola]|uniref:hydroxymethylglutaryl-CoA lyase n=1 Tax=Geothrix limicola TaxID=2927978 RepID=UPI002555AAEC|nr:hydroxymethylglutaryl-CoA lyase [Geothrix limicola]